MVYDGIKNFISNVSFEIKNENGNLVSLNGSSITFRLSITEVYFYYMSVAVKKSRYQAKLKLKTQINKPAKA